MKNHKHLDIKGNCYLYQLNLDLLVKGKTSVFSEDKK